MHSGQISPAEGNWGCIALVDNTKAGLLTIFAGSYGYASANFGSAASGTGNVQLASDGATFLDGTLFQIGVQTGLITFDANGADVLTLYTTEKADPQLHAALGSGKRPEQRRSDRREPISIRELWPAVPGRPSPAPDWVQSRPWASPIRPW